MSAIEPAQLSQLAPEVGERGNMGALLIRAVPRSALRSLGVAAASVGVSREALVREAVTVMAERVGRVAGPGRVYEYVFHGPDGAVWREDFVNVLPPDDETVVDAFANLWVVMSVEPCERAGVEARVLLARMTRDGEEE